MSKKYEQIFTNFLTEQNLRMVVVNSQNYSTYETFLNLPSNNICNREIITKEFEMLAKMSLEEPSRYGIFITSQDMQITYSFVIVDFLLSTIMDKLDLTQTNVNKCVEITLICSSNNNRILGLTKLMMESLFEQLSVYNVNRVYLYIAKKTQNSSASKFYKLLGFEEYTENSSILYHNIKPLKNITKMKMRKRTQTSKKKSKIKYTKRQTI